MVYMLKYRNTLSKVLLMSSESTSPFVWTSVCLNTTNRSHFKLKKSQLDETVCIHTCHKHFFLLRVYDWNADCHSKKNRIRRNNCPFVQLSIITRVFFLIFCLFVAFHLRCTKYQKRKCEDITTKNMFLTCKH